MQLGQGIVLVHLILRVWHCTHARGLGGLDMTLGAGEAPALDGWVAGVEEGAGMDVETGTDPVEAESLPIEASPSAS